MLPTTDRGSGEPTLVLLHLFGSSKREWTECIQLLAPYYQCIAADLPGYGEASEIPGYTVDEMTTSLQRTLQSLKSESFVLVGHSLSGKVAMALAARNPPGLVGLILVAPSPPSPEPIDDQSRAKMLAMQRDRPSAEKFLDGISARPLTGVVRERAIDDFIRCSPAAWKAWLRSGSKEDWSGRIGSLDLPALLITGSADPSLSASVQEKTTMRHLPRARLEVIADCGHLPTMEAPTKLSALIANFLHKQFPLF